jgi:hypothetical protein
VREGKTEWENNEKNKARNTERQERDTHGECVWERKKWEGEWEKDIFTERQMEKISWMRERERERERKVIEENKLEAREEVEEREGAIKRERERERGRVGWDKGWEYREDAESGRKRQRETIQKRWR